MEPDEFMIEGKEGKLEHVKYRAGRFQTGIDRVTYPIDLFRPSFGTASGAAASEQEPPCLAARFVALGVLRSRHI